MMKLKVSFSQCVRSNVLWQVNLTGIPHGLSFEETKELWLRADLDGNGVFDYEELKVISVNH